MDYDFIFTRKDRVNLKARMGFDRLMYKDGHWHYLDYSEDNHWRNADNYIQMYLDERYYAKTEAQQEQDQEKLMDNYYKSFC